MLPAILSVVMGILCFFLPHTPPAKDKAADPWAFREAFVMFKNKNFLIFMMIAFVVTTELQFYYGPTEMFLKQVLQVPVRRHRLCLRLLRPPSSWRWRFC